MNIIGRYQKKIKLKLLIWNCKGNCKVCKKIEKCRRVQVDSLFEFELYKATGLKPHEVEQLKVDEEYWHREAIKHTAALGELKMKLDGFIESNSREVVI